MTILYAGIDIASKTFQAHWQHVGTGEVGEREFQQCNSHYQTFIKRLKSLCEAEHIHVVMEATGNYWLYLALALYEAEIAVSVINPQQAYHFAQSQLQRAKSDRIDARLLCDLLQQHSPDLWTPPPAIYHGLYQRLTLRQELQDTRTQYRNRLHALRRNPYAQDTIIATYEQLLTDLKNQIKQLDKEIEHLLLGDHEWHDAFVYLCSIPGISTVSAAWILVKTHAFARCDTPEQAVAFAGLAPHERSSGQWQGRRYTGGGHARLRSILYLCAGSAIQHNPPIKAFYQRLVKRGKIKQVARVASARKLLVMAWACVTKQRLFDPNFQQQLQVA
jgi:transposase